MPPVFTNPRRWYRVWAGLNVSTWMRTGSPAPGATRPGTALLGNDNTYLGATVALFGPGGGKLAPLSNFFAGDPGLRSGVVVAAKSVDGDAFADLVTAVSTPTGGSPAVPREDPRADLDPYPGLLTGVFVG